MKIVPGGITAAKGFQANGISCGLKRSGKKDLALIYSLRPAKAAGMFTQNRLQAAPLRVTRENLKSGLASAIIINSGNANCSTGKRGMIDAQAMTEAVAEAMKLPAKQVLVASTGIIGKPLPIEKIKLGINSLVSGLSSEGGIKAAEAILTTDTRVKECAVKMDISGKVVTIGAMAKGAGMIYPNLATMLVFIATDALIEKPALSRALKIAVDNSFNCITVDGCTSTNDTVLILANGLAGNAVLKSGSREFGVFSEALNWACFKLAQEIVRDAEGATKFVKIMVGGAPSVSLARKAGFAIANSLLFKTALFGENENWGRIVAALGQAGISFNEEKLGISFTPFKKKEICVRVDLRSGAHAATIFTNDISYQYIKINAGYN
ncbi:MAG: bifunctional glutamate N-acetyltransferase/amino-acid acetyltransferase ArgJ [Candidatus Omnitrophota bacterium]